jgi:hypothetical protein
MRIELQLVEQPLNGPAYAPPAVLDGRCNRFDYSRFTRHSEAAQICLVHTAVLDSHQLTFRLLRQIGARRPANDCGPNWNTAPQLRVNFVPTEDFEVAIKEAK